MVQEQLLPYYIDDVLEKISQQTCSSASGLRFFFDAPSQLWMQSLKLWAQHWLRMQLDSMHEASEATRLFPTAPPLKEHLNTASNGGTQSVTLPME